MPFFTVIRFYLRIPGNALRRVAKTASFIVAAGLSGLTATANTADDTFSCLNEMDGLLYENLGSAIYANYDWFDIPDEARFDARGAVFLAQTDPALPNGSIVDYPVDLRSDLKNTFCWAGGVVHYTNDLDITWWESKHPNNAAIAATAGHSIFDGVRIHNAHDAIRPRRNPNGYWEIRNSWISYNRDDCIENDYMSAGMVDDSLFDGCWVFLSSQNNHKEFGVDNLVTIQNSLIRLQELPGPYKHWPRDKLGHGPLFKYQKQSPRLALHDNIFLIEDYPSIQNNVDGDPEHSYKKLGFWASSGKLDSCSGNVIVWLGPDEFPGNIPDDPSCVTVTKDKTVWDDARAKWLAEHPLVMRIQGVDDL